MMRRCYTNAPDAYDYSYVVPVGLREVSKAADGGELRVKVHERPSFSAWSQGVKWTSGGRYVDIPAESYDYQTARYQSGMYYAVEVLN